MDFELSWRLVSGVKTPLQELSCFCKKTRKGRQCKKGRSWDGAKCGKTWHKLSESLSTPSKWDLDQFPMACGHCRSQQGNSRMTSSFKMRANTALTQHSYSPNLAGRKGCGGKMLDGSQQSRLGRRR
jgi:hypothetical protein